MKAIAEYFRDLAADDRYFGAEPPTPDADMLARIAEREMERRVEARIEERGVVLRPSLTAPLPDAAPTAQKVPAEGEEQVDMKEPSKAEAAPGGAPVVPENVPPLEAQAPFVDLGPVAPADADPAAEQDAEPTEAEHAEIQDPLSAEPTLHDDRLQRGDETEAVAKADAPEIQDLTDPDQDADHTIASVMQTIDAAPAEAPLPATKDGLDDHAGDEQDAAVHPASDPSNIAEKLQRIRAAVAREPDPVAEPEPGQDQNAAFATDAATALQPTEDLAQAEPALQAFDDTSDDPAEESPDAANAGRPRIKARVTKVKRADFDAALTAGHLEEVAPDVADSLPIAEPVPGESTLSADDEADLARELAEVASELDDLPNDADDILTPLHDPDHLDEAQATRSADDAGSPPSQGDASEHGAASDLATQTDEDDWDDWDEEDEEEARKWAEAEARIKAEAAEQAEMEATIDRLARESVRKTVKMSSPARAMLTENAVEEDAESVSRLLDETNTHLDEPEGNRRRSAIAHLRAAVAATRADRILGGGRKNDSTEAYREDLANVVRPRRPQGSGSTSDRPSEAKPAPLKLVAEQRVDTPDAEAPAPAQAIRPRRVSAVAEDDVQPDPSDGGGFNEFAESVGASQLPDLLEAAAAYMSFVEGREQFSRPQLMTKVRQAETQESSREDRLRSFGQLLREKKIDKVAGGRFTANASINFKPRDTKAG